MTTIERTSLAASFLQAVEANRGVVTHFLPGNAVESALESACDLLALNLVVLSPSDSSLDDALTKLSGAAVVLVNAPLDSKLMGGELLIKSLQHGALKGVKFGNPPVVFVQTSRPERFPQFLSLEG